MEAVAEKKGITLSKNGVNSEKITLDYDELQKAAMVLRAINHPLRQKMIELIDKEGSINVTKIYVKLRLEQSVASQHLAILRNEGFVNAERDGKFIYYSVNKDRISEVAEMIDEITQ